MSEYQRYEFMTVERPLTPAELAEVEGLSSHIEATFTHAVIEYNWGDFKYNPIGVLRQFFDGFLYWANWGSPRLAFRFPHGVLPADFIEGYDFEDLVTFTLHEDYDILDIHFGEMEGPDEWVEYSLGSLIPIRDELMEGDLRALYIVWLASYPFNEGYYYDDGDKEEEEEEGDTGEEYDINIPPVPPGFDRLTAAQQALAELLQVPQEQLIAAGRHSQADRQTASDDFVAWIKLLSPERRDEYLLRLAHNEPGLGRQFTRELRELGRPKTSSPISTGERVPYDTLLAESERIEAQLEQEGRERAEAARLRHLQDIHTQQEEIWKQATMAAERGISSGYDEAVRLLIDLREAARHYQETGPFQERFQNWVLDHSRRPALLRRLRENAFGVPEK
ncbi:MAG TPA: hypothetical protein VFV38_44480 [Ktedonobacteraceae bacterium]|nr:hypothetical protein [Ktedonobacteraceae bacterium]